MIYIVHEEDFKILITYIMLLLSFKMADIIFYRKQTFEINISHYAHKYVVLLNTQVVHNLVTPFAREAPWPSGRASVSEARGRGFDPHSGRRVVSFSKIHLPP